MGCVHAVVEKKILLVQFEYGQKVEINPSLILFLSSNEEVEMDEPLSNSLEKEQGGLLTIDGVPEVVEPCMCVKVVYLSVFYFFCYEMDISTDMSEEQVSKERYPNLI